VYKKLHLVIFFFSWINNLIQIKGVIGLDGRASDCPSSKNAEVESILNWAHFAGKSTGIVTTTRVCKFIVWNLLLITWAINLFFSN